MFPTDAHLDQMNADGTGFAENRARWLKAHGELLSEIAAWCRPVFIELCLGSDQWNIDTMQMTTTRGTPQDNALLPDASTMKVADVGLEAIEMARAIAPVRVRVLPGNHDYKTCLMYFWALQHIYKDQDDIEVVGGADNFQYSRWGQNLFGWHHGHGMSAGSAGKALKLTGRMASEVPELWGETTYRYWMIGHREHLWEHDDGTHVMQAPTVKGVDRYHDEKGFVLAKKAQTCWAFGKDRGQIARFMAYA